MAGDVSPTSSRKMVPPSASSKSPLRSAAAPVKAPRVWPNSSDSRSDSGSAPQFWAVDDVGIAGPSHAHDDAVLHADAGLDDALHGVDHDHVRDEQVELAGGRSVTTSTGTRFAHTTLSKTPVPGTVRSAGGAGTGVSGTARDATDARTALPCHANTAADVNESPRCKPATRPQPHPAPVPVRPSGGGRIR